jgi:hypothetical protein
MRLQGWREDADEAFAGGNGYFKWWDNVKTGVLVAGILAVMLAYRANESSKR